MQKSKKNKLTIVMPLRGRSLFTLRFLYFSNLLSLPYNFILADGLVHPEFANILEDHKRYFPNISLEYIRYPDDRDFSFYFRKMADAVMRVQTPYAMLIDNDDFVLGSGVEKCIESLDNNDWVGCSGRIAGFSLYSGLFNSRHGLTGRFNRWKMYWPKIDLISSSIESRLSNGGLQLWPLYAVYRKDVLATICNEIAELEFSDLQIYETYHTMRALSLGKVRMEGGVVSYVRQYGTSLNASFKRDWIHHLVRSRFSSDIEALVERISQSWAEQGGDNERARELVLELLEAKFRQIVQATYGSLQEVKHIVRRRAPELIDVYRNWPRPHAGRELSRLLSELRNDGGSKQSTQLLLSEICALRTVVSGGAGFEEFVEPFIPIFSDFDATNRKKDNVV